MSIMNKLHKFIVLPYRERILLVQAFVLLALIRLGLGIIPFRWLKALVQWVIAQESRHEASNFISIDQVNQAIRTATYYLPGQAKCLAQALVTQILLKQYGYDCDLLIGVAKNEQKGLTAHAWIERNGQILIGGNANNLSSFTTLFSINSTKK